MANLVTLTGVCVCVGEGVNREREPNVVEEFRKFFRTTSTSERYRLMEMIVWEIEKWRRRERERCSVYG